MTKQEITKEERVGTVVAAGKTTPKWLYVTEITGTAVIGRTWSAKSQKWTKGTLPYHRSAIGLREPVCVKPKTP